MGGTGVMPEDGRVLAHLEAGWIGLSLRKHRIVDPPRAAPEEPSPVRSQGALLVKREPFPFSLVN